MTALNPAGRPARRAGGDTGGGAEPGQPLPLLLLPGAATPGGPTTTYYLARTPQLVRDAAGDPVFSLTLVLSRQPRPDEPAVEPLILSGVLGMDVTVAAPQAAVDRLPPDPERIYRPLFVREAVYTLVARRASGEQVLATGRGAGTQPRAALSATLGRDDVLAVLSALARGACDLSLIATLEYGIDAAEPTVHLAGTWAAVYDFLDARLAGGPASRAQMRPYFEEMLRSGVLTLAEVGPGGQEVPASGVEEAVFAPFMRLASVILRCETPELASSDPENRYTLGRRPHPAFNLDYTQRVRVSGTRTLRLAAPLDEVLGGALEGLDRSRFITSVAPRPDGGLGPVAPRTPARQSRSVAREDRSGPEGREPFLLVARAGGVGSVAVAMRPQAAVVAPQAVVAASLARPAAAARPVQTWWLDDVYFEPPGRRGARSLPVVEDPDAPLWNDRLVATRAWYAPAFEIVQPPAEIDPAASPFLFSFQRTGGVTELGQPALTAMVRVTLRRTMRPDTAAAIQARGRGEALAVPTSNPAVSLTVPFLDSRDNSLKRHVFSAEVVEAGDQLVATVHLLNQWVNLCYGALAYPGFQREPARIHVAYSFEGYVPVRLDEYELALGGKAALLPVAFTAGDAHVLVGKAYFDAREATLRLPEGDLRLRREEPLPEGSPAARAAGTGVALAAPAAAGVTVAAARPPAVSVARPPITAAVDLATLLGRRQYALQSLIRHERADAVFPCDRFDVLYREELASGSVASGCQEALKLGETSYREYDEVPALHHPLYRVYRSLQQPGRFLVVPTTYRVARFAPTLERAYEPAIMVYVTVDPEVPANNRVNLRATLMPDIPPYARRQLLARLAPYASGFTPVLEYPTDLALAQLPTGEWTVDPEVVVRTASQPGSVDAPGAIEVILATDPAHFLNLRTLLQTPGGSVRGTAQFRLPDATVLQSGLAIDLSSITGPWPTGPLEGSTRGTAVRLVNRIERRVVVTDLDIYPAGAPMETVPVNRELAPGEEAAISLPRPANEVYPVYSIAGGDAATLEEVRSFVEDIHTNVLFVDQINHANHDLKAIEVQAQIKGVPPTYTVEWRGDTGVVDMVLPLTTYLANRIVVFRVRKLFNSGATAETAPIERDLAQGNVIGITWELIA